MQEKIRNFCIIAHIDHGKSTLADRMLEVTGTVAGRDMKAQLLDTMELEQERGITIKLQPATMRWKGKIFNLIDTPGHADFSYEVSRTLAACEGAILLVDASQGVQAQTIANVEMARQHDLTIIPVAGKTDLPAADPDRIAAEIEDILAIPKEEIIKASGKTGDGVAEVLDAIAERIPAPSGKPDAPLRALVFDSRFDSYRGVIASLRVVDGKLESRQKVKLMAGGKQTEASEVGTFTPALKPSPELASGKIGYIVTGLKEVADVRVGDTLTSLEAPATEALPGYAEVQPMVFAGLYAESGADFEKLRDALGKLALNDASLVYEPTSSSSLGMGFRCGFLGLLHLDIIQERLKREHGLALVITSPTVSYEVEQTDGTSGRLADPSALPDVTKVAEIREPWAALEVVCRTQDIGAVQKLIVERRGVFVNTQHLGPDRVLLQAEMPLAALVIDFYDALKGATSGYGSLSYHVLEFRAGDLVKLDFLVAGDQVESLALIVDRSEVEQRGRAVLAKLKEVIPPELFQIALQAVIGGKIVARENISSVGKNVTAKLYGGDVTRKRKLLEKQKKGKQKLKSQGRVKIPPEAFTAVLGR